LIKIARVLEKCNNSIKKAIRHDDIIDILLLLLNIQYPILFEINLQITLANKTTHAVDEEKTSSTNIKENPLHLTAKIYDQ
jgi:hypothetical protein